MLPVTAVYAELPDRIVSLAPSTTEILFAMGLGNRIVGVTNFCDYPEEVINKTSLLSFPQAKRVGNPSDSPLEKGMNRGCLRKIPDKPE